MVIFDDVFVPWENVLLYRDINRCNQAYARTGAVVHMTHQVVVKNIAKAEFMLGLAHLLVDAIGAEGFQHIHEKLAELWVNMETMRAFLRAAEADAALDEWGVMRPAWNPLDAARNLFPRLYPRMVEIIQQIGASRPRRDAERGGSQGPARRGYQALLPGGAGRGVRPYSAVPSRLGRIALGVRLAPGAVRTLFFRRPGAHGGRPARQPPIRNSRARGTRQRLRPRGPDEAFASAPR